MKTIRAMLLAAMHRWRIAAYGFEDEDDVARMVAAQFGAIALLAGGRK